MINQNVIVLDLDGVIIDTLPGLYQVFCRFVEKYSGQTDWQEFSKYNGLNLRQIVQNLTLKLKIQKTELELVAEYQAMMEGIYSECTLTQAVEDFLCFCQELKLAVCIASSASRKIIQFVLERFDLTKYIDLIVSGDDVIRAKPDPEIYQLIQKHYGSKNYIVVDDSQAAILTAQALGFDAWLFSRDLTSQPGLKVLRDFDQLSALVTDLALKASVFLPLSEIVIESKAQTLLSSDPIELYWQQKITQNTSLFDGPFLILSSFSQKNENITLRVNQTRFKNYIYQKDHKLPVIALGVSAIVTNEQGLILIGRRSELVSNYQNYYELVPSGNLSPELTALQQLELELEEEAGIDRQFINQVKTLGLIYDVEQRFLDICYDIKLENSQLPKFNPKEYSHGQYVTLVQAERLLLSQELVVPTSRRLFELYRANYGR